MAELRAGNEALELDEAIGWTVVSRDDESGTETHFGFYAEPAAALEWAAEHEKDVNRGNPEGEPGWTARVVPIFRAEARR